MYCRNCGNKLMEGGKFCPTCGEVIQTRRGRQKPQKSLWRWFVVAGCCIAVFICAYFFLINIMSQQAENVHGGFGGYGSTLCNTPETENDFAATQENPEFSDAESDSQPEATASQEDAIREATNIWPVNNPITDASFEKKDFYTTLITNDAENECLDVIAYEIVEIAFSTDEVAQLLEEGHIDFSKLMNADFYDNSPKYFEPERYTFVQTDNPDIIYLNCETDGTHVDNKPWPTVDGAFDPAEPDTGKGIRYGLGYADYQLKKVGNQYVLRQLAFLDLSSTVSQGRNALFLGNAYKLQIPYGVPMFDRKNPFSEEENDDQQANRVQDIGTNWRRYLGNSETTDLRTVFSAENGVVTYVQTHLYYDRLPLYIHRLSSLEGKFQN